MDELNSDPTLESAENDAGENLKQRLLDMYRPLTDADIDRIRCVQTPFELLDCSHHFHLHYGGELAAMREYEARIAATNKKPKERKKKRDAGEDDEERNDEDEPDEDEPPEDEPDDDAGDTKVIKYASKKDRYHHCKLAGLCGLAKKFGLTSEQLGENLECDYQKHEIEQWAIAPADEAHKYVKEPYFTSTDQVLNTVRYMIAMEMSREPAIRSYVRDLYFQRACLTVRPTIPRGYNEIDETHPCYTQKYLNMKPCIELKRDEYLRLVQAEQDGLVTIKFELRTPTSFASRDVPVDEPRRPPADDDDWDDDGSAPSTKTPAAKPAISKSTGGAMNIHDKLKSFYLKDEFSYNVEKWNEQRGKIIDELLEKFLYPEMERELRTKLVAEAKEYIFKGRNMGRGGCLN